MAEPISPLWATLLGGSLSLTGSLGATWWAKYLEKKNGARQLAKAIKGELSAIVHIVTLRGYSAALRNYAQHIQATNQPILFSVQIKEEYCRVYKSNADKIGTLSGNLPTDIAIVYTQVSSVLEDFSILNNWMENPDSTADKNPDSLVRRYVTMADLMDDTLERAAKIVSEIDNLYP